jgi:hypothetical protein
METISVGRCKQTPWSEFQRFVEADLRTPTGVSANMVPKLDAETLELIGLLLPNFDPVVQAVESPLSRRESLGRLDLPPALGADYFFQVWLYGDVERQISARPTNAGDDSNYFWHRPFDELVEQPGSREELIDAFCDVLKTLLTRRTRVVQRKSWLFWHFRCEYSEGNAWKLVYRHFAFRGGKFKPPSISGRRRVYQSDAIALDLSGPEH